MTRNLSPSRYILTVPCILLLVTACAQDRLRLHREVFPSDYTVEVGEQSWLACRAVDGVTGQPIAGAELFLVKESETPLPGEFWFTRKATSDANGFIRVRIDDVKDQWNWIVLRAEGFAAATCMSGIDDVVWPLMPGQDVPVRVRDWQGRPVAGAQVSFCGGCGHTPDLQHATTGPDGLALLRDIDPQHHISDLYAQHGSIDLGYEHFSWFPGDPPVEFVCGPSVAITGRLVDHQGAPIAGAFVGTQEVHRGPWAKTDANGTFRLLGSGLKHSPAAVIPGRKVYFERPKSFPAVFRAPEPDGQRVQQGTVEVARHEDGGDAPPYTTEIRLLPRGASEEPQVQVRRLGSSGYETDGVASSGRIEVPTDGPFCFVLSSGRDRRYFAFASTGDLPDGELELPWFRPTTVVGSVVDADGKPVSVRARVVQWSGSADCTDPDPDAMAPCPNGRLQLPAEHSGLSLVQLQPERNDLRSRLVFVSLPARGDKVRVELGTITLSKTPGLRVLGPDRDSLRGGTVQFARAGLHAAGRAPAFALDADGGWLGPDLRAGDAVVVTAPTPEDPAADAVIPFRTVLQGAGPWTLRLPATSLTVRVADAADRPLSAVLFVGDLSFDVNGQRRLRHIAPGKHRLFVAARGRLTAEVVTEVRADGENTCRVVLPER